MKIPSVSQVRKGWNIFSDYYVSKMENCTFKSAAYFFTHFQEKYLSKK